jgi:hypothetical protein
LIDPAAVIFAEVSQQVADAGLVEGEHLAARLKDKHNALTEFAVLDFHEADTLAQRRLVVNIFEFQPFAGWAVFSKTYHLTSFRFDAGGADNPPPSATANGLFGFS